VRTRRARGTLAARLDRLESRSVAFRRCKTRFGNPRQLPRDYNGERHIGSAQSLRRGREFATEGAPGAGVVATDIRP
jgi:hypothetical protein